MKNTVLVAKGTALPKDWGLLCRNRIYRIGDSMTRAMEKDGRRDLFTNVIAFNGDSEKVIFSHEELVRAKARFFYPDTKNILNTARDILGATI